MKRFLLLVTVVLLCASCSILCNKKLRLKKTTWACSVEEFVADAGTMTVTTTVKFTSAKDFIIETEMYMPAYPSMYMNTDGSHDIIPASSSTWTTQGTYSVKGNDITLTGEDGKTYSLNYVLGKLHTNDLYYQHLILEPQKR